MTDYSLSSKQIVLNAINDDQKTTLTLDDVIFGTVSTNASGMVNSKVTLSASPTSPYRGDVTVNYNRTDLSETFSQTVLFMSLGNIKTTQDLIARINSQYRRQLTTDDIIVEPVTPSSIDDNVTVFTLKVAAGSYAYTGSADIYFADTGVLKDWVRNPTYEYQMDGKSLSISGTVLRLTDSVVLGKKGTFTPADTNVALSLTNDGTFKLSDTSVDVSSRRAVLSSGQLMEITGPSGETSYGADGKLLPTLPILPPAFDNISKMFQFSGEVLSNGSMHFTTPFAVSDYFLPFGPSYYVDSVSGNDQNDGLTAATALKTLDFALGKPPQANVIYLKGGGVYTLSSSFKDTRIALIGTGDALATITGATQNLSWSATSGNNSFTTTVSQKPIAVVDSNGGTPDYLRLASSLAALNNSSEGSYFVDGTSLYVRLVGNRQPDDSVAVIAPNTGLSITGSSTVYLDNVSLINTATGVVIESIDPFNKPTLFARNSTLGLTVNLSCLNSFGANVYLENVTGTYGFTGGSFYGGDRQAISMGVSSEFIEYRCDFYNFPLIDLSGMSVASTARRGSVGIRFESTYDECNGYLIQDVGAGTYTANFNVLVGTNTVTDVARGAAVVSGSDSSGINGRSVQLILGATTSSPDKFSFASFGAGEQHLYNTPVGTVAQYGKQNPYRFIYSSPAI